MAVRSIRADEGDNIELGRTNGIVAVGWGQEAEKCVLGHVQHSTGPHQI